MDIHRDERLTVKVQLLGDPCLWCWEIVDSRDGSLIEASWATHWTGYTSSRQAFSAGLLRLTDLTRHSRAAWSDTSATPTNGARSNSKQSMIVGTIQLRPLAKMEPSLVK